MVFSSAMQIKTSGRLPLPADTTPPPHPASVFMPSANITFMDLPVETRMHIFGYILQQEEPIAIQVVMWKHRPREVVRRGHNRKRHHRREVYDKSKRSWVPALPTYAATMFMKKQVYAEASQALYSRNTFSFSSTSVLEDFLLLMGHRAQYLRYIEIGPKGYVASGAGRAFNLLRQAKGLTKLQFDHSNFCDRLSPSKLSASTAASVCKKLLSTLHASYQEQNLTASVLDVIQISKPAFCYLCTCGDPGKHTRVLYLYRRRRLTCDNLDKHNDLLHAEMRTFIAGYLGISDA